MKRVGGASGRKSGQGASCSLEIPVGWYRPLGADGFGQRPARKLERGVLESVDDQAAVVDGDLELLSQVEPRLTQPLP